MRPQSLAEFVGQQQLRNNLEVAIRAARQRREPLDHILFCGPPGLGKTTLAFLLAGEMDSQILVSSGPALVAPKELAGILTRLTAGDILFLDEIHRLPRPVEEFLYSAMEDRAIDITLDHGAATRAVRLSLAPFTLVGATTREGLLAPPFRSRFGIIERLQPYGLHDLVAILGRATGLLGCRLDADAALELARRSRGVPRISLRLLRRLRDLAQVRGASTIDCATAIEGLEALGVDGLGLEQLDRQLLQAIVQRGGGPVGLKTLCAAVGETEDTIELVYEPYLLRLGFLSRTHRGRVATERAWRHLGVSLPAGGIPPEVGGIRQQELGFDDS